MDSLTIDLFAPGMGPLHRAGLGGLAATLRRIDKAADDESDLPGEWDVDERSVTLRWQGTAAVFFERLYALAFQIRDGLIYLPGSYGDTAPRPEVLAELQQGMSQTILQFGPNRKSRGLAVRTYEDDARFEIQHQDLVRYTHQDAWCDLVDRRGGLKPCVPIAGTIAPGFIQRHVAFPATTIEQGPGAAVSLHFALVGTLSLAIDRRSAVLLVPDVEDLREFARRRPRITPSAPRQCRVAGPADAALQAQVRLHQQEAAERLKIDRCLAVLFATKSWNEKQKARAAVLDVAPDLRALERFEVAVRAMPARVAMARPEKKGQEPRPFWADSLVRPLVAENLARGRPWYEDFRRLVVGPDGADDAEKVRRLGFEKEGLKAMIDEPWEDRGEEAIVRSIHEAIYRRFGMIGQETSGNKAAFGNRAERQMQRWRLSFANAKTADEFRDALADLWSRSGGNDVLRSSWHEVLPHFCSEGRWRLTRDLALLALASYQKPASSAEQAEPDDPE